MGQLVGCIAGMRAAAAALEFPVVSGNVSLYNETNGEAILPTPVVGGLGLIEDVSRTASIAFKAAGEGIVLIGATAGWLGCQAFLRPTPDSVQGAPPPLHPDAQRRPHSLILR